MRAVRWVRANDMAASHRHWEQAQVLLVPLPDSAERTHLLLQVYPELINMLDRLGADAAESDAIYGDGIAFSRQVGSRRTAALIEAAYGYLLTGRRDFPKVIEHGRVAVALAEQEGDVPVEIFGRFVAGRGYPWSARPAEALAVLDPVASKADGERGWDIEVLGWPVYAEALPLRAVIHAWRGRLVEALAFTERLSAQLKRPRQSMDLTSAACDRMWTWLVLGDAANARRNAAEALLLGERFGSLRNTVYALLACGAAPVRQAGRDGMGRLCAVNREVRGMWGISHYSAATARDICAQDVKAHPWTVTNRSGTKSPDLPGLMYVF